MQTHHSEFASEPSPSPVGRDTNQMNYILIMRQGRAAGVIPALEAPRLPSELRDSPTRTRARRWAARQIGWLT